MTGNFDRVASPMGLMSLILRSELAGVRVDPVPTHLRLRLSLSVSLSGIGGL